jgi:plastocyanin
MRRAPAVALLMGVVATPGVAQVPPESPAGARGIAITDTGLQPTDLVAPPGTRIVWHNEGFKRHTVTADSGAFDSGPLVSGERFELTAQLAPGTYAYHCSFHSFIRGTLTISRLDLRGPAAVPYGARATLTGTAPQVAAGTPIRVERRTTSGWEEVQTVPAAADGTFRVRTGPLLAGTAFRALTAETLSPAARVAVHAVVSARRRGATLRVAVRPARPGLVVRLERLDLDRYLWRRAGAARLGPDGQGSLRLPGAGVYRARVAGAGPGVTDGASRPVPVRATPAGVKSGAERLE